MSRRPSSTPCRWRMALFDPEGRLVHVAFPNRRAAVLAVAGYRDAGWLPLDIQARSFHCNVWHPSIDLLMISVRRPRATPLTHVGLDDRFRPDPRAASPLEILVGREERGEL